MTSVTIKNYCVLIWNDWNFYIASVRVHYTCILCIEFAKWWQNNSAAPGEARTRDLGISWTSTVNYNRNNFRITCILSYKYHALTNCATGADELPVISVKQYTSCDFVTYCTSVPWRHYLVTRFSNSKLNNTFFLVSSQWILLTKLVPMSKIIIVSKV